MVCRDGGCNPNDSNVQKSAEYPATIRRSLVLDPNTSTKYHRLTSSDELSTRRQTSSGSFHTPDITEHKKSSLSLSAMKYKKEFQQNTKLRQSLINIQHDCRTIMSAKIIAAISKQNIHCTK